MAPLHPLHVNVLSRMADVACSATLTWRGGGGDGFAQVLQHVFNGPLMVECGLLVGLHSGLSASGIRANLQEDATGVGQNFAWLDQRHRGARWVPAPLDPVCVNTKMGGLSPFAKHPEYNTLRRWFEPTRRCVGPPTPPALTFCNSPKGESAPF